ncbi:MAG: ATP synthase F1 subunit gamma [Bacteroidales bacterium]|jgi:F-type H+-transporting ATPase subunit gamma|nr:ATP synthase F1 subunit gamma [Bacteroidales bacterium]
MAGIKEIRTRIASVTNTQKITSAMKMVSAAKLRKAQQAVTRMRPYSEKLQEILQNVSSGIESNDGNPYATVRNAEKVLIIAVASNSGLCGGFNSNIAKATIALLNGEYAGKQTTVYSIGKKAQEVLKSKQVSVAKNFDYIYDELTFDNVAAIAGEIMSDFVAGSFDKVIMVYNSFKNAATQIITEKQFLPIEQDPDTIAEKQNYSLDYISEPSKEAIAIDLIPRSLKTQFYSVLLDSYASEHGARMTAMHKATDNAGEMLHSLRIEYNKARQSLITNEILEIVSGANALKG